MSKYEMYKAKKKFFKISHEILSKWRKKRKKEYGPENAENYCFFFKFWGFLTFFVIFTLLLLNNIISSEISDIKLTFVDSSGKVSRIKCIVT